MSSNNQLGDFLRELRISSGYKTQKKLSEVSSISTATISRIEAGIHLPTPETLGILSRYLKGYIYEELLVAAGYMDDTMISFIIDSFNGEFSDSSELMLQVNNFPKYTPEEKIQIYRKYSKSLSHNIESLPLGLAEEFKNSAGILMNIQSGVKNSLLNELSNSNVLAIPLVTFIRSHPTNPQEIISYLFHSPEIVGDNNYFALVVDHDDMIGDRIHKKDIVIVKKQNYIEPNEIAVVSKYDNKAKLCRIKQEKDMCMLIPSNPAISPSLIDNKHIHIFGKVVEVRFWP